MILRVRIGVVAFVVCLGACSDAALTQTSLVSSTAVPTTFVPPSTVATTSTTSPVPTTIPVARNEIVIGLDEPLVTLNPFSPDATAATFTVAAAHMAGAHDVAPDLQLLPDLVVELPTPAGGGVAVVEDGLAVEWSVNPQATWSDGVPVTGHDFMFTWDAMVAAFPDSGPPWVGELPTLIQGVATDESVQLVFEELDFRYETLFAYVLPQHVIAGTEVAEDWDGANWPSSGPFVIDDWDAPGGSVRFVRNENYWRFDLDAGVRLPYLDAVEFRLGPNGAPAATLNDFTVDAAHVPPASVTGSVDEGVVVETVPGRAWEHVAWQFGPSDADDDPVTQTLAFRRAVATALSASAITEAADGLLAEPPPLARPGSYLPAGADGGWTQYGGGAARAEQLLEDACRAVDRDCLADPPVLRLTITSNATLRPQIAAEIEQELEAALPIRVEIVSEDAQDFFGSTLEEGSWDVAVWAWIAGIGRQQTRDVLEIFDPDAELSGEHPYGWGSPGSVADADEVAAYRERLGELRRTVEPRRFDAVATEMVQILADDVVIIPIASRSATVAWRTELEGPAGHADPRLFTWNLERWRKMGE